jgi:hypothetical protein
MESVRVAQGLVKQNRAQGLAALNTLFRAGVAPASPLDGRYAGELIALDFAPGFTQFTEMISGRWMPWKGKIFDAGHSTGDNFFTRDSFTLAHVYWPFYRGYLEDGPQTYRAFRFITSIGPGKADPDRQVLRLDYGQVDNPGLSVRRVLDEVVQVGDGYYLGKAHLKWWWGTWQLVAYFSLVCPEKGLVS